MDKYAINLKWCLTRWWSSWQPDYFTKLTASYPRLSLNTHTRMVQSRGGVDQYIPITLPMLFAPRCCHFWYLPALHHHPPLPSHTLIHILQSFPAAPHPVPSAEKEILALLWILTASYHQSAAAQGLGSTQTWEKTAITHQPKGGSLDMGLSSSITAHCFLHLKRIPCNTPISTALPISPIPQECPLPPTSGSTTNIPAQCRGRQRVTTRDDLPKRQGVRDCQIQLQTTAGPQTVALVQTTVWVGVFLVGGWWLSFASKAPNHHAASVEKIEKRKPGQCS